MRRASASVAPPLRSLAVTILGVLRQFLDNLRLARGREVQVRQLLANLIRSSQAFSTPVMRLMASTNVCQPCRWEARTLRPCAVSR